MGFYDSDENVRQYLEMAEGYDGMELIKRLGIYLNPGSTVLEIGMGPGVDLLLLSEFYRVTGSDTSKIFLNRYRKLYPNADLMKLDAVTLDTDRTFDAVFSNKVMHHLSYDNMIASFNRQSELLNQGGIVMHSFWYGSEVENYEGLMFHQITEDKLKQIIPGCFNIVEMRRYTEMAEMDSLYTIMSL